LQSGDDFRLIRRQIDSFVRILVQVVQFQGADARIDQFPLVLANCARSQARIRPTQTVNHFASGALAALEHHFILIQAINVSKFVSNVARRVDGGEYGGQPIGDVKQVVQPLALSGQ